VKVFLSLLCFLSLNISVFSQAFEGKIVYKINIKGEFSPQEKMMLPSEAIVYSKGEKSRMEMSMGFGMNTTTITNAKLGTSVSLMNILGSKYAIESNGKEVDAESEEYLKNMRVENTSETKTIAGYNCKKAIIHIKDPQAKSPSQMEVWFTKELAMDNVHVKGPFQKIEGAMLEFNLEQQGMNMNFQAQNVSKENVDNKLFEVPDGYKKMTQQEMMKMMGGK
jgi:GLPGLI family protein